MDFLLGYTSTGIPREMGGGNYVFEVKTKQKLMAIMASMSQYLNTHFIIFLKIITVCITIICTTTFIAVQPDGNLLRNDWNGF